MVYGIKENVMIENEDVLINYSNKVPYIVVDDVYSKNTALLATDSISNISRTLIYLMGDTTSKTVLILKGKKNNKTTIIIIVIGMIIYLAWWYYSRYMK